MEALPALNAPLQWRVSDDGELQIRGGSPFLGYYRRAGSVEDKGFEAATAAIATVLVLRSVH